MNYLKLPEPGNSDFDPSTDVRDHRSAERFFCGLLPIFTWIVTLIDVGWGLILVGWASLLIFEALDASFSRGAAAAYRYAERLMRKD